MFPVETHWKGINGSSGKIGDKGDSSWKIPVLKDQKYPKN